MIGSVIYNNHAYLVIAKQNCAQNGGLRIVAWNCTLIALFSISPNTQISSECNLAPNSITIILSSTSDNAINAGKSLVTIKGNCVVKTQTCDRQSFVLRDSLIMSQGEYVDLTVDLSDHVTPGAHYDVTIVLANEAGNITTGDYNFSKTTV